MCQNIQTCETLKQLLEQNDGEKREKKIFLSLHCDKAGLSLAKLICRSQFIGHLFFKFK